MRSFVICLLFVSLIGDALCGRLRRQAPPAGIPAGGAALDGPPEGITTPANTKADGLNSVIAILLNDVNTKSALGEPVDPKKVETILKLSMVINIIGGEVSEPNKEGIANLLTASPDAAEAPPA